MLATVKIATESPEAIGYTEKDADGKCSLTWTDRLLRIDALDIVRDLTRERQTEPTSGQSGLTHGYMTVESWLSIKLNIRSHRKWPIRHRRHTCVL